MTQAKKLLFLSVGLFFSAVAALCVTNVFLDPFYYYRMPKQDKLTFSKLSRYQNPALLRHLDYDTIIVGTSRTANFTPDMFEESDWQILKVSANGSGGYLHRLTIDYAMQIGKAKRVILEVSMPSYIHGKTWVNETQSVIPEYLYKPSWTTPFQHLLTLDYLGLTAIDSPVNTEVRRPLEALQVWYPMHQGRYAGAHYAALINFPVVFCDEVSDRTRRAYNRTIELEETLRGAVDTNLFAVIDAYPNTEFRLFFPPLSALKDFRARQYHLKRKAFRAYVISGLLKRKNTMLYDFATDREVINQLDRFKDFNHYDLQTQRHIAKEIQAKDSEYILKDTVDHKENDPLTDAILSFDPSQLHVCGGDKGRYKPAEIEKLFRQHYRDYQKHKESNPEKARDALIDMRRIADIWGSVQWWQDMARVYLETSLDGFGPKDALDILNSSAFDYIPSGWFMRAQALSAIGGEENKKLAQMWLRKAHPYGYRLEPD